MITDLCANLVLFTQILALKRGKILTWLYPEAFDKRHLEVRERRQNNTGGWILEEPSVQGWIKEGLSSRILWGYGICMYWYIDNYCSIIRKSRVLRSVCPVGLVASRRAGPPVPRLGYGPVLPDGGYLTFIY